VPEDLNDSEQESTEEESTEETEEVEEEESTEEESEEDDKKLPEWAEKELKEVRSEAANYRIKLREAMQKLEKAKSPEEYEAATKELLEENEKLNREILIRDIARDFELPKELSDALKGATEEELKAHAEVLKKFAPAPKKQKKTVVPTGGLDPADDDEFDPVALVQKNRSRRR
jgi:hypothetical protein